MTAVAEKADPNVDLDAPATKGDLYSLENKIGEMEKRLTDLFTDKFTEIERRLTTAGEALAGRR